MIVECVPNFSEGRDARVIDAIADAVAWTRGVSLLHRTSDEDHNRSVLTFAGDPEAVRAAALAAAAVAVKRIDLRQHAGVHPRLGAIDVLPFVPVEGIGLEGCAEIARETGRAIWEELRVPVYLYGAAALRTECRNLEGVRRGAAAMAPDYGHGRHKTAGACVAGARKFLIAWNINLKSSDLAAARAVAREVRASGGGLPAVKALGFALESRGQVQISMNLVDFEVTPLPVVFQVVSDLCAQRGIEIEGSELIGMIPAAALEACAGYDLRWLNLRPESVLENALKNDHEIS